MVPLHWLLFFAMAAPQQQDPTMAARLNLQQHKLSLMQTLRLVQTRPSGDSTVDKMQEYLQKNTCFTMRSYFFRRQDGQAPVPAGMTTCTPASVLQQRRVSPAPQVRFVPLGLQEEKSKEE
jgi:hypothetical protein